MRMAIRAFQVVKTWSKQEIVDILGSEALANWLSVEQMAELQNFFSAYPRERFKTIPMAWSICEAWPMNWKMTYEPLKLWSLATCPQMGDESFWIGWVPVTWPSYVVQLRWNIMTATARNSSQIIRMTPASLGFPLTALTDMGISAGGHVYRILLHFMLPTEHALRVANENVPLFESPRDVLFSTWKFKEAMKMSAWDVFVTRFRAQHEDTQSLLKVETTRQAWNARLASFWKNGRWKIPKSVNSGLGLKNFRELRISPTPGFYEN